LAVLLEVEGEAERLRARGDRRDDIVADRGDGRRPRAVTESGESGARELLPGGLR